MAKEKGRISGKRANFEEELGAVTDRMLRQRAREIALIKGRERPSDEDRDQARRELLEFRPVREEVDPMEEGLESLDPSQNRMGTGHQTPDAPADDEEVLSKQLVERGVREADHEQMVAGYEAGLEEESEELREIRQARAAEERKKGREDENRHI